MRLPRRRRLLGGALPAGTAGARAGGAADEPAARSIASPRFSVARSPTSCTRTGTRRTSGRGWRRRAGRRADHHHRLPQPDDGAALPAHRAVHVAEEPPHPGELDRRARTSSSTGRGVRPEKIRVIYNLLDVESISSARREAERAAARAHLGPAGRAARHRAAGAGRPAEASAGRLLGDARAGPARALAEPTRWCFSRGASAIARTSASGAAAGAPSAARGRGALPRRGQGRALALLGLGPLADAVALRGAGQRGARRRARPGCRPSSRTPPTSTRSSGPATSGWEVPTGRQGALVRALEEALATPDDRLREMGRRRRRARRGAVCSAAEPRARSDGGGVRRAAGGREPHDGCPPVELRTRSSTCSSPGRVSAARRRPMRSRAPGCGSCCSSAAVGRTATRPTGTGGPSCSRGATGRDAAARPAERGCRRGRDLPQRGGGRKFDLLRGRDAAAADHRLRALADDLRGSRAALRRSGGAARGARARGRGSL